MRVRVRYQLAGTISAALADRAERARRSTAELGDDVLAAIARPGWLRNHPQATARDVLKNYARDAYRAGRRAAALRAASERRNPR